MLFLCYAICVNNSEGERGMYQETRYAIIIGINDYSNNPLAYCVNDADSIAQTLIEYCMFEEKNIFKIISNEENSLKDITGQYLENLRKVKENFRERVDSILFYFAGHGSQSNDKSVLWFQDSPYPIEEIFEDFCSLTPRVQTYIIDACQSGNKVLTRSIDNDISKFINLSEGASFLYACRSSEGAQERADLAHGLLTHNLLSYISNRSSYDEDGYLTFNRIVDFVQKNTIEHSEFSQTPVVESRISGFYPFAILKDKLSEVRSTTVKSSIEKRDLREVRNKIQERCIDLIDTCLNSLTFNNYSIADTVDFNELTSREIYNSSDLKEKIVKYTESHNLVSLNKLIYQEEVKVDYKNNLFGSVLLSLDKMYNKPQSYINYVIDFHNKDLYSKFKICMSNDIEEVSFGIGVIFYQAKWGAVLLYVAYLIDWDGEQDNQITNICISHITIPLKEQSLEVLKDYSLDIEQFINPLLDKWNDKRLQELKAFETDNFM